MKSRLIKGLLSQTRTKCFRMCGSKKELCYYDEACTAVHNTYSALIPIPLTEGMLGKSYLGIIIPIV